MRKRQRIRKKEIATFNHLFLLRRKQEGIKIAYIIFEKPIKKGNNSLGKEKVWEEGKIGERGSKFGVLRPRPLHLLKNL